jgi:hypothetical protein
VSGVGEGALALGEDVCDYGDRDRGVCGRDRIVSIINAEQCQDKGKKNKCDGTNAIYESWLFANPQR